MRQACYEGMENEIKTLYEGRKYSDLLKTAGDYLDLRDKMPKETVEKIQVVSGLVQLV